MGEHVDGLYLCDIVGRMELLQVTGLSGWVTADIDDTFGCSTENGLHHVGMHAGTRGIGDDDIRTTVLRDKIIGEDILHVAGIEEGVFNAIDLRVDLGILDSLRDIFDTDDLAGFLRNEVGNGACTGIEIVYQRRVERDY